MSDSEKQIKILIAIPSHNEEDSVFDVVQAVTNETKGLDPTVVVFDDASDDGTPALLQEHRVKTFRIKKSFGLGYVFSEITKYFLEEGFDILVTIDGDGQFNPKDVRNILKPIIDGDTSVVTGSRFIDGSVTQNISRLKHFGNKLGARYVSSILGYRYYDVTCGFRAYAREAILQLHTFSDFTYTQEVFLNLGFKKIPIQEVPISTTYFKDRKSKMVKSVFRYVIKSFNIILKSMLIYSPLRLFGGLSFISLFVSLTSGIFVFAWNVSHGTVTPFKWLAVVSVVSISLSVFLYCIGILLQITSRIQFTLEENLYYQKKNIYK